MARTFVCTFGHQETQVLQRLEAFVGVDSEAARCGKGRQGAAMCGKVYTFNCPPGEEPEIGGAKRAGLGEERLVPWRQHTLDHASSRFFVIDDRAAITNASTDCGN